MECRTEFQQDWLILQEVFSNYRRFTEAFYFKYFAGDYLKEYLEMAFCCANYYEADWTTTRKSLTQQDNLINPIRCNAKMYMNFGYAVDLFPKDASDAYLEAYNSQRQVIFFRSFIRKNN